MPTTIQDYLAGLKGKSVAVIGIGVSNTPLIKMLLRAGIQVTACDRNRREEFGGLDVYKRQFGRYSGGAH